MTAPLIGVFMSVGECDGEMSSRGEVLIQGIDQTLIFAFARDDALSKVDYQSIAVALKPQALFASCYPT